MNTHGFPTWRALVAVGLGAAVGALLRWGLGAAWPSPAALWVTNVLGSGVLGLVTGWHAVRARPLLALALGPGLLGGFTSVSAAAEDVRQRLADGDLAGVTTHLVPMLLAATAAVGLGRALADRWGSDRPARATWRTQ